MRNPDKVMYKIRYISVLLSMKSVTSLDVFLTVHHELSVY